MWGGEDHACHVGDDDMQVLFSGRAPLSVASAAQHDSALQKGWSRRRDKSRAKALETEKHQ